MSAAKEPLPPDVPVVDREHLREQMRQQMLTGFGGWTGMAISAAPTVVFIVVNAVTTLLVAVIAAVACALVLVAYRLMRRESIQQAASGLFGVVIAALIAARTGQARGFFLIGIWSSFAYGAVFLGSILVRRPVIGVLWEFLDPTPAGGGSTNLDQPTATGARIDVRADDAGGGDQNGGDPGPRDLAWHRRPVLLRAYMVATAGATMVFAARGVIQLSLFKRDSTGWLAVTRIAMGYPLTIAVFGFAWLVVRRARARLATTH